MAGFTYDFDVRNYSVQDLEKLFRVGKEYTEAEVSARRDEFRKKILDGAREMKNRDFIERLDAFLHKAHAFMVYFARSGKHPPVISASASATVALAPTPTANALVPSGAVGAHKKDVWGAESNFFSSGGCVAQRYKDLVEPAIYENTTVSHSEFNKGDMNPLHTRVLTRSLVVDTRFRANLYSSSSANFTMSLPSKISNVVSMQLTAYEFPVAFYGTSAAYGNNFIHVFCTYQYATMAAPATSRKTIVMPDGNYSVVDLATRLNAALRPLDENNALVDVSYDSAYSIFNCVQFSLDVNNNFSGSGKITLAVGDAVLFQHAGVISSLSLDFSLDVSGLRDTVSVLSKMGWNLGFIYPKYAGATSYTGETLPEPAALRYIYLSVNDYNRNVGSTFVEGFDSLAVSDNILARIAVNGQYFGILMENDLTQRFDARKYFGPVDITKLHFQLLDDHGRALDINSANYSLCLSFQCLYV